MEVLMLVAVASAVLGMFQYGYALSVLNPPQAVIQNFIEAAFDRRHNVTLSHNEVQLCFSIAASITKVGGLIGAMLGGVMADRFGRRKALLLTQAPAMLGAFLMGICKLAESYELLLLGRLFTGLGNGLFALLCPLYVSEVAPIHVRGAFGTFNQFAVTTGILTSMTLGLSSVFGGERLWPLLLSFGGILAVVQFLLVYFVPESPLYLICMKKDLPAGEAALRRLHGIDNVEFLVDEILRDQHTFAAVKRTSVFDLLCNANLRLPLFVCVCIHLSQQLCGIMALTNYSTTLLETAGIDPLISEYCTLAFGVTMVVVCLMTVPLMDRFGRRLLHLSGLAGILVGSVCIIIASNMNSSDVEKFTGTAVVELKPVITNADVVLVSGILIFGAAFALGPAGVPWMIIAEIFPENSRAAAASVSTFANWIGALTVALSFPQLEVIVPQLSFLPFTLATVVLFAILLCYLPETKNQTASQNLCKFHIPDAWTTAIGFVRPEKEGCESSFKTYGAIPTF